MAINNLSTDEFSKLNYDLRQEIKFFGVIFTQEVSLQKFSVNSS